MSGSQLRDAAAVFVLLLTGVAACAPDSKDLIVGCKVARTCPCAVADTRPPACDQQKPPPGYGGFYVHDRLWLYLAYLPNPMPVGPLPLIVSLGQPIRFEAATDSGFVIVAPQGPLGGIDYGSTDRGTYLLDEVRFISALVDTFTARYPIDPARVFVAGFADGATMAYHLAHELSGKFAAVGALSGQEWTRDYARPTDTVAVVHVHGLTDLEAPYLGGGEQKSVPATIDAWRSRNGCLEQPETVLDVTDKDLLGLRWRSPSGRGDVVLYTHPGGHGWPGWPADQILNDAVFLGFFKSLPPRAR